MRRRGLLNCLPMTCIPFDSLTLASVVAALQPLCGGRVQRISQPDEHEIVLTVYRAGRGEVLWLLNCSTLWGRTHLVTRRAPNPPQPPTFCMTLRKYLDGGTVLSIAQRRFDRVLDVQIRGFEGNTFLLTAELMGRHSNLILVSPEEQILHAAKRITHRESRVREVLPGRPYTPPPAPARPDPRAVTRDHFLSALSAAGPVDFVAWLGGHFEGMSKLLAQEIAARSGDTDDPIARWDAFDAIFTAARQGEWQPVLVRDEHAETIGAYPLRLHSLPASRQEARATIHIALEEHYARAIPRATFEAQRRTLLGHLRKTHGQRSHALDQVRVGVHERKSADRYRRWGELLLANLYQLKPRQDTAEVLDYYSEEPATITVPLDADLTPQENAERYFQRARHVEANATRLQELQQQLAAEKSALEELLAAAEQATDAPEVEALQARAAARGWLHAPGATVTGGAARPTPDFGGKRIRVFTSAEGWQVFVGENAEANDYLVQRVANSNDWWLHVRAGTSAHVVIRTHNAPQNVPLETLQFAARLAAARSAGRHAGVVAVDYTLRKYVRRPRGGAPGLVTYTHEKTLHVSPAEEAAKR